MMSPRPTQVLWFRGLVLAFLLFCRVGWAADELDSYYAPPTHMASGLILDYSQAYSPDYINLNPNPPVRFGKATAAFHYDRAKGMIPDLKIAIAAGSLDSPDKALNWMLLERDGLDVNRYEEISLMARNPAVFDEQNKAVTDGRLTMHGISRDVKIELVRNYVQTSNPIASILAGEKGAIGLSITVNFRPNKFGMTLIDGESRSRGDLAKLRVEMRAIRQ